MRIAIDRRRQAAEFERERAAGASPQSELSVALAAREALFLAAPGPVLMYAPDGQLVRANRLARDQPQLVADPPTGRARRGRRADRRRAATVETVELTVYGPERRRYEAQLRPYATERRPRRASRC